MYVEIRQEGKRKKYYLSHTYRVGKKVKKISRYLGSNLTKKNLEKLKNRAQELIYETLKENILKYELTKDEITEYEKYDNQIKISHLQTIDWKRFTSQFTYNTNAIEGSTVELSEVKNLLDKKEKPANLDELETINVAKAVEFIKTTKEKLSVSLINKIHAICFRGTKSFAGKLREVEVIIRDSDGNIIHRGASCKNLKALLDELCKWYVKHKTKYPPLLLAAAVHNQFEHIHPFQDGNGRVGRLLLNYVLLKHKYPPINVRLKDRVRYYKCLGEFDMNGNVRYTIKFLIYQYKKQYG